MKGYVKLDQELIYPIIDKCLRFMLDYDIEKHKTIESKWSFRKMIEL